MVFFIFSSQLLPHKPAPAPSRIIFLFSLNQDSRLVPPFPAPLHSFLSPCTPTLPSLSDQTSPTTSSVSQPTKPSLNKGEADHTTSPQPLPNRRSLSSLSAAPHEFASLPVDSFLSPQQRRPPTTRSRPCHHRHSFQPAREEASFISADRPPTTVLLPQPLGTRAAFPLLQRTEQLPSSPLQQTRPRQRRERKQRTDLQRSRSVTERKIKINCCLCVFLRSADSGGCHRRRGREEGRKPFLAPLFLV